MSTSDVIEPVRFVWKRHLVLFVATALSVIVTGALGDDAVPSDGPGGLLGVLQRTVHTPIALLHGAEFAAALLAILTAHEFGHYFAARIHRVETSLPFFIPLPVISPFGTMGAVIKMRGAIRTRRALLDIGAAGPLAGLVLALPLYAWGVAHSTFVQPVGDVEGSASIELGESLVTKLLDRLAGAHPPDGMNLMLSPVAYAAWAGLFVTMINMIPAAQLDGGHVAYALFGKRQNGYARWVHRGMLLVFATNLGIALVRVAHDLQAGLGLVHLGSGVGGSLFWLVWFEALAVLGAVGRPEASPSSDERRAPELDVRTRLGFTIGLALLASYGRTHAEGPTWAVALTWSVWFGALATLLILEALRGSLRRTNLLDHPPTDEEIDAPLGTGRRLVAIGTLLVFPLLFMPAPISF